MRLAHFAIHRPIFTAIRHGHLLKEFLVRDIKGRFAGSMAGTLWTIITPAANILVFIFIFSLVLRIKVTAGETGTDRFVLFFLSGMFPWMMFSDALMRSVGSLVDNSNLITRVVFPVDLLPLSAVLSATIVNGIGLGLFLAYLVVEGFFHPSWFLLILIMAAQFVFAWGLACALSAGCVFLRDTREMLGIVLMVWFYATPVIYPLSMVPKSFRAVIAHNPMGMFITLYRDVLLRHHIHMGLLVWACALSVISYIVGVWFFSRSRSAFGDVL